MVLGIGAQEDAAVPLVLHLLRHRETEVVAVEGEHRVHVRGEEPHRTDARDLERTREQYPPYLVLLLAAEILRARALLDGNAVAGRLFNLRVLGLMRKLRRL